MPVVGGDQTHRYAVADTGFRSRCANPIHDISKGEVLDAAQGDRREAQFHVTNVIGRGVLDRLPCDAVDDFGCAKELSNRCKL